MTTNTTSRFALPLLAAGQADKELTHNEALACLDILLQPVVQAVGLTVPPPSPLPGQCWIVGPDATDAWARRAGDLAGWTDGGWRFILPREGLCAWDVSRAIPIVYRDGLWQESDVRGLRLTIAGQQVVGARQSAIPSPAGGSVVDEAARGAITAILTALRGHGLIGPE